MSKLEQEINVDDLIKGKKTFKLIRFGDSSTVRQVIDHVKKRPEIVNVGLTYISRAKREEETTLLHTVFFYIKERNNDPTRPALEELGEAIINSPEFNMDIYDTTRNPLYFALENVEKPINSELQIFFAKMAAKMLNVDVDAEQAFKKGMRHDLFNHLACADDTISRANPPEDVPEDVKKIWEDEIYPINKVIENNYLLSCCERGSNDFVTLLPKSDLKGAFLFLARAPILSEEIQKRVFAENPGLFFIQSLFPLVLVDIINDYYGFQDVHKNALKKVTGQTASTTTLNASTGGSSNRIASDNSIGSLLASSMSTMSSNVRSSSPITSTTFTPARRW